VNSTLLNHVSKALSATDMRLKRWK